MGLDTEIQKNLKIIFRNLLFLFPKMQNFFLQIPDVSIFFKIITQFSLNARFPPVKLHGSTFKLILNNSFTRRSKCQLFLLTEFSLKQTVITLNSQHGGPSTMLKRLVVVIMWKKPVWKQCKNIEEAFMKHIHLFLYYLLNIIV